MIVSKISPIDLVKVLESMKITTLQCRIDSLLCQPRETTSNELKSRKIAKICYDSSNFPAASSRKARAKKRWVDPRP
jgi:hypothetical protein